MINPTTRRTTKATPQTGPHLARCSGSSTLGCMTMFLTPSCGSEYAQTLGRRVEPSFIPPGHDAPNEGPWSSGHSQRSGSPGRVLGRRKEYVVFGLRTSLVSGTRGAGTPLGRPPGRSCADGEERRAAVISSPVGEAVWEKGWCVVDMSSTRAPARSAEGKKRYRRRGSWRQASWTPLETTCLRRGQNSASATSRTHQNGLEITTDLAHVNAPGTTRYNYPCHSADGRQAPGGTDRRSSLPRQATRRPRMTRPDPPSKLGVPSSTMPR